MDLEPNVVHSCCCFWSYCCWHCEIIKAEAWRALLRLFTVLSFSWLLWWGQYPPRAPPTPLPHVRGLHPSRAAWWRWVRFNISNRAVFLMEWSPSKGSLLPGRIFPFSLTKESAVFAPLFICRKPVGPRKYVRAKLWGGLRIGQQHLTRIYGETSGDAR